MYSCCLYSQSLSYLTYSFTDSIRIYTILKSSKEAHPSTLFVAVVDDHFGKDATAPIVHLNLTTGLCEARITTEVR